MVILFFYFKGMRVSSKGICISFKGLRVLFLFRFLCRSYVSVLKLSGALLWVSESLLRLCGSLQEFAGPFAV